MCAQTSRLSADERLPLTAAVLAGGRSRRMGTDKRVLPIGGRSMLSRVVDATAEACERTLVVVAHDDERTFETDYGPTAIVVRDTVPNRGPIGGLITALTMALTPWTIMVAADMPFLESSVIRLLWERRGDGDAVVVVGPRGPEPLLALYHQRCLVEAMSLLDEERTSPRRLLEIVRTVKVSLDEVRVVDSALASLMNINTPNEYSLVARLPGANSIDWPLTVSGTQNLTLTRGVDSA